MHLSLLNTFCPHNIVVFPPNIFDKSTPVEPPRPASGGIHVVHSDSHIAKPRSSLYTQVSYLKNSSSL